MTSPSVFLCHASENNGIAAVLARDLIANGIQVFLDQWEIRPGDSIRQKIDAGLTSCTHFVALLTLDSLPKPWVNAEMDAAFVRKVEGCAKFIPLRMGVGIKDLPPLLQGIFSPSIDNYDQDLKDLVSAIHEVSKKPDLGSAPPVLLAQLPSIGLSPAAQAIIRLMVQRSEHGNSNDPMFTPDALRNATNLSDNDILDAVDELEPLGFIISHVSIGCGPLGFHRLASQSTLFVEFDKHFMPWDPEQDALRLATALMNHDDDAIAVPLLAEKWTWLPRRMNPAITFLADRGIVKVYGSLGSHPWAYMHVWRTPATRRYVSDHS